MGDTVGLTDDEIEKFVTMTMPTSVLSERLMT